MSVARYPRRLARGVQRRLFLARRPLRVSSGRAAQLDRVLSGLRDFDRLMCAATPGGRLVEREGVLAAVVPAAPDLAMVNTVVYERPGNLAAALDELTAIYENAGVRAWAVLTPAVDREAKRLLSRAGHLRTYSASGMARDLRAVPRPDDTALEAWTSEGDPATLAAICDRTFRAGDAFAQAFSGLARVRARVYLADLGGEPVSCIMTSDHDRNCAIDLMATLPEAQGRGLATPLLGHALADAADRGCNTTTVVASRAGERVYGRLGYQAVCPIQHWVRRRT